MGRQALSHWPGEQGQLNMEISVGAKKTLDRIGANCELLHRGYHEDVDYVVQVAYHVETCKHFRKSTIPRECECPVVDEKRTRKLMRKGLLDQLYEFSQNKDTDRNPKAERGAPRVKVAGRPPGDLGGFFALDEITCEIHSVIDRVLEEVGADRTWASMRSTHQMLAGLRYVVADFVESHPDQAGVIDKALSKWVATARSTLRITVSEAIFDSVVCGNCGVGGLSTPWGNEGEVRCVGTPAEAPCGHTYPMTEWVGLYERGARA